MAPPPILNRLRLPAAVLLGILLAWIVYQTVHAGSDIPPPSSSNVTQLSGGSAGGKRIDGRSWSLDYTTATMSPDGQSIAIDNVRDGLITHDGKPFARMQAAHVVANVGSNNFSAQGPVVFTELAGRRRQIRTVDATYDGEHRILTLVHPAPIHDGAMTVVVDHATMNFATGETKLGRITGTM
jgi:hypothetical protein